MNHKLEELIKSTPYVEVTDIVPKDWPSFWDIVSEDAPFTWGINNRTLVAASDFKDHAVNRIGAELPEVAPSDDEVLYIETNMEDNVTYSDYMDFVETLEELGEIYIDLEN